MANYNYFDNTNPNFTATITLNSANQTSDSYQFQPNRAFTFIVDNSAGFTGTINLQLKIDSANYYTVQSFNSATVVKQIIPNTRNSYWRLVTSSDFSGTATVIMSQSRVITDFYNS